MPFDRGPELCFRVDRVVGKETKRMDIPAWMFDRGLCAAMIEHQGVPYVRYGTLRSLQDLIRDTLSSTSFKRVEQEHLPLIEKGNAREENPKATASSRTTEPIRRKAKSPKVDRSAKGGSKPSKRCNRPDSC